jgi:hypothetical protein
MDDAQFDRLLEVLNANMYCHIHIDKQSIENMTRWKLSIMEIRKQVDSESVKSIECNTPESIESQTRAPTTQDTGSLPSKLSNLIIQNRPLLPPRPSRSLSPDFNRDPATFWPEIYDITLFEIIARSVRLTDHKSSYNMVRSEVTRSLDSTDQKGGYVYLYEVEGNKDREIG